MVGLLRLCLSCEMFKIQYELQGCRTENHWNLVFFCPPTPPTVYPKILLHCAFYTGAQQQVHDSFLLLRGATSFIFLQQLCSVISVVRQNQTDRNCVCTINKFFWVGSRQLHQGKKKGRTACSSNLYSLATTMMSSITMSESLFSV